MVPVGNWWWVGEGDDYNVLQQWMEILYNWTKLVQNWIDIPSSSSSAAGFDHQSDTIIKFIMHWLTGTPLANLPVSLGLVQSGKRTALNDSITAT